MIQRMYEEKLREIINQNQYIIEDMEVVRSLGISNTYIAAGYIRNLVWDLLHGYPVRTSLDDVDVIYFDPLDLSEETEKELDKTLKSRSNKYKWSVKNQARMHILKNDTQYASVEDAMKRWPETATVVGIRLDKQGNIEIIAPYGLEDLFKLKIRQSPYFTDKEYFLQRIKSKQWLIKWPLVQVTDVRV
ncbi:nucleotidyltransferase family protein [Tepidibacillus marianensis]|uniref:nucleotidyltransferase family protein n=1 Tax=Tepidibacillus marianensis TaxID=3131995 RepID=UPI0030D46B89